MRISCTIYHISWQNVLRALTNIVSGRVVGTDDVITNGASTLLETTSNFSGGLPDNLGEVVVGGARRVVVIITLIVPGLNSTFCRIANGQILTVRTARVSQGTGTVVLIGVVLGVALKGGVPSEI